MEDKIKEMLQNAKEMLVSDEKKAFEMNNRLIAHVGKTNAETMSIVVSYSDLVVERIMKEIINNFFGVSDKFIRVQKKIRSLRHVLSNLEKYSTNIQYLAYLSYVNNKCFNVKKPEDSCAIYFIEDVFNEITPVYIDVLKDRIEKQGFSFTVEDDFIKIFGKKSDLEEKIRNFDEHVLKIK